MKLLFKTLKEKWQKVMKNKYIFVSTRINHKILKMHKKNMVFFCKLINAVRKTIRNKINI